MFAFCYVGSSCPDPRSAALLHNEEEEDQKEEDTIHMEIGFVLQFRSVWVSGVRIQGLGFSGSWFSKCFDRPYCWDSIKVVGIAEPVRSAKKKFVWHFIYPTDYCWNAKMFDLRI